MCDACDLYRISRDVYGEPNYVPYCNDPTSTCGRCEEEIEEGEQPITTATTATTTTPSTATPTTGVRVTVTVTLKACGARLCMDCRTSCECGRYACPHHFHDCPRCNVPHCTRCFTDRTMHSHHHDADDDHNNPFGIIGSRPGSSNSSTSTRSVPLSSVVTHQRFDLCRQCRADLKSRANHTIHRNEDDD